MSYFKKDSHQRILRELLEILNVEYYKENNISSNSVLNWKKVCITWSFELYSREQLALMLEKVWWIFVTSVSNKTDFLLAWDKAWSKLKKANDFWINVLSLDDFLNMIW